MNIPPLPPENSDRLSLDPLTLRDARPAWILCAIHAVLVLSIHKYDLNSVLCLLLPLAVALYFTGTKAIYTRLWIPFTLSVLLLGLANPLLDTVPQLGPLGQIWHGGWLSFTVIFLKSLSTFLALRIMVTHFTPDEWLQGLNKLGLPASLTTQLHFTTQGFKLFRTELAKMQRARSFRSFGTHGYHFWINAHLLKQFLMRCLLRSHAWQQGLTSRGFTGVYPVSPVLRTPFTEQLIYGLFLLGLIISRLLPGWIL